MGAFARIQLMMKGSRPCQIWAIQPFERISGMRRAGLTHNNNVVVTTRKEPTFQ